MRSSWQGRFAISLATIWLCGCPSVSGWHAFLGGTTLPNIRGTSIRNYVEIPEFPFTFATNAEIRKQFQCIVAVTSLRKAFQVNRSCFVRLSVKSFCLRRNGAQVCEDQIPGRCDLGCVKSLDSAFRDIRGNDPVMIHCLVFCVALCGSTLLKCLSPAAVNTSCPDLESAGNEHWPDSADGEGLLTPVELYTMEQSCVVSQLCISANSSQPPAILTPNRTECPHFNFSDSTTIYPFLTWKSVEYYQSNGDSESGGLTDALGASQWREYNRWTCVPADSCDARADDKACFKYSHVTDSLPDLQMPFAICL